MRHLIINADDYGLCYAANQAVEELFDVGVITTTTLMTPCPWAEDAVERAKRNKKMQVGLHITTTCEYETYKWGPIDHSTTTLTDQNGYFHQTARENLQYASMADMTQEILAQYAWMASRGLPPEHIDSHMGTVYGILGPSCMDVVFALCKEHGLHFRLPKMPETFFANVPAELRQMIDVLSQTADRFRVGLPNGLFTYDYDVSSTDTYEIFRGYYMDMVSRCPEGVSELFVHPCIETEELKYINAQWKKRVWEYQIMKDPVFKTFLDQQNINLCSYHKAPFFDGENV